LPVVDWAAVTSTAITGAVGIAGVAGAIISARIAGKSARDSAGLNINAEADRARLAEKRRIYARALGALDSAALAVVAARSWRAQADSGEDSAEALAKAAESRANANALLGPAHNAVSELRLIAPGTAGALASKALTNVDDFTVYADLQKELFEALRADLDEEAQRSKLPESSAAPGSQGDSAASPAT
jgi:hypothetical protein